MSVLSTLPAPVIQMGLVEKLVESAQNQPLVQQAVAQESALQSLREQHSKVQNVDEQERTKKIRDRDAGRESGREAEEKRRRRDSQAGPSDDAALNAPSKANPWAGQLLNMKI